MSRALYRGLSTPERIRPQLPVDDPGSPTKVRDEQGSEERPRNRPVWETCFPHSIRLWIKQNWSLSSSSHKPVFKTPDPGLKSGKVCDIPSGPLSLNSSAGSTTGFFTNCFSFLSCDRKQTPFQFLLFLLLFLIGAFVLISLVGFSQPIAKVVFPPHNYRRAQLLAWRDLLRGGILGRGSLVSNPREVAACPDGMEDYVPCYNVTANLEAGYTDGREFERHCESIKKIQCLVPPPKDYRILLQWPDRREGIWRGNLQISEAARESRFLVEEDVLKFPAKDEHLRDEVGSHAQQVAGLLGLSGVSEFTQARIHSILDIGCGLGSLGAHLWDYDLVTMCVAPYEEHGGQVQIALERGLPAMVGSLAAKQLPYPSSSYDLIHCAECGIDGHLKYGKSLFEIDRLLRVGGYFVSIRPVQDDPVNHMDNAWIKMHNLTASLGWEMVSPFEHDVITIWQKKAPHMDSMMQNVDPILVCKHSSYGADWAWDQPLRPCKTLSPAHRQISVQEQLVWPSRLQLEDTELATSGPGHDETTGEPHTWTGTVADYWSLLTPGIFSDHPRRLADGDTGHSAHLVRNMMDMNAGHGELNAALTMSGKQVWVMNIIPSSASNTLPFIFDRGLIGAAHDWCQPFPTYPRTYDFLHAADLLSQELKRQNPCGIASLFLEMDRILRPEGWVFLRDEAALIDDARAVTNQMRWESRLVEVLGDREQRLLVCQKTFWKA